MSIEVLVITEIFYWITEEEGHQLDEQTLSFLKKNIGDIINYLVSIADKFEIEILEVGIEKIKLNTKEYPASQVRGGYIEYD